MDFIVLPSGQRVPFVTFVNDVPPQDLDALMAFDREIMAAHPSWSTFARHLCPSDGPEGQVIKGDHEFTAHEFWSDVDTANATVTIVTRVGPGARARQFWRVIGEKA